MSGFIPIALIPARAGSKRLPGKNLAQLGDRPLLAWSISAVLDSGVFGDEVWVSSDSEEILAVATEWGARAHERGADLSGDRVTVNEVCLAFASHLPADIRDRAALYIMLPTCPFRRSDTIRRAWSAFEAQDQATALLSVVELDHPPQWSLVRDGNRVRLMDPPNDRPRQDIETVYRHDGGHMITAVPDFLKRRDVMAQTPLFFEVAAEEAVDINTPLELAWAEFILARRQ